jgi:hypothetical protein
VAIAQVRIELLSAITLLAVNQACVSLGRALVDRGPIPEKAALDALHIAVATVHGMDYLLTWNCKHIANAEMQTAVNRICRNAGYEPPVICTPEELLGS